MFVDIPTPKERLIKALKITIPILAILLFAWGAWLFVVRDQDQPSSDATQNTGTGTIESALTPEQEVKLQEEVAPLIKAGDMKACDSIANDMYKKVCINNIALNKANETKDISYCQYLDNELIERASCERQILAQKSIEQEDKGVCSETKDEQLKQECEGSFLSGMAQKKGDPTLCDKHEDEATADECFNGYHAQKMAMLTGDKSMETDCNLFRGSDVQADCNALTAAQKSNDQTKLMEACQSQKSPIFGMTCMMATRPGAGQVPGMMQP